jgi:flagellar biosynthesis/type III secretory pathway protein FliH
VTADTFAYDQLEPDRVVGAATAAERAALIVSQAKADARDLREAARAQGYEEGLAAGLAEARARVGPAADAFAEAVSAVEAARDELVGLVEERAVELAVAIAEKIVGAAVDVRPELVLEVVGGALRRVLERDFIVLEVNPADLELVRDAVEELTQRLGGFRRIEVVAERRVGRGGCIVRTGEGEIDARIAEQLERAAELLRESLAAGRPDA